MKNKPYKVLVRFDQQQLQLLDSINKKAKLGKTYQEIIKNAFRTYIRQNFGEKGP